MRRIIKYKATIIGKTYLRIDMNPFQIYVMLDA